MINTVEPESYVCVEQRALIRNYRPGEDWIPGAIIERRGPEIVNNSKFLLVVHFLTIRS